ncbi:MAG TPA: ATP-binding domain-containing protein [Trebonia sp.]|jgi:DNA helicase IV|nr:ATP-binding domain-containing protein [Trebonia sp.]
MPPDTADPDPDTAAKTKTDTKTKTETKTDTKTATKANPEIAKPADPVVRAERAHLVQSREFLRRMRENVLEMAVNPLAGDPVSLEFLKADLHRRAEALKDLPDAPLFFGRLDYEHAPWDQERAGAELAGTSEKDLDGLELHIGRRHVADPEGTPVVIDWRAPVSRPFYRASTAEPMGLRRRRRFGFAGGELTAYEDEAFESGPLAADGSGRDRAREEEARPSSLLVAEIERPRSGPMRDIVATIQPEQDDIVRADATMTVCVQGAPGTGKTAVGLHRIAYLLYAHKEQVTRRGVMVVGPNPAFLSYIRNVLPALGELDVKQTTVPGLLASVPVKATDSDEAALVKGDPRMAEVLRRALWGSLRKPSAPLVVARGSRRWRVPGYELTDLALELQGRGLRYGAGRELLGHRIAHVILTQMESAGETCDDRTHDAVRRTPAVRACVDEVWPKVDPKRLVFGLLSAPQALAAAASGILSEAEQAAIAWSPAPRGPGSAKWSRADLALLDEAADLIERTASLAHVVVDEAQDLSPMEIRALGRRCTTGAATVLGDIAQGTTPWSARSWEELLGHLGKPAAAVRELDTGYRVPRQILDFASQLLPVIAPGLRPASSLRADPAALSVIPVAAGELGPRLAQGCESFLTEPGSVAVICADAQVQEVSRALRTAGLEFGVLGEAEDEDPSGGRLAVVPVTLAKGLEFDHVVLVEPGRIAAGEAHGLRRLYVALTRAVSRLIVLYAEPLPSDLRYVP